MFRSKGDGPRDNCAAAAMVRKGERTYVPETEDNPWCQTRLPIRKLGQNVPDQTEQLVGVIVNFAVELMISITITSPTRR